MQKKITITTTSFARHDPAPLTLLEGKGFLVAANTFGRRLNRSETIDICSGSIGIVAGTEIYDQDILERLSGVRVISRCGVGMGNVDIDATSRLGIKVYNTPDAPTLAVAELTVGLILNLLRKINQADAAVKGGKWDKLMGRLILGKKVGVIGFGRIGRKVGELLSAFGVELACCDIEPGRCSIDCSEKGLDEILGWADIITLHVSAKAGCGYIIGERELGLMRPNSLLINTSRGEVVDEKALYRALKDGRLSGAALDVYQKEPYAGPLIELNNIILTPHIGSYAKEARVEMEKQAVKNLLKGLEIG